MSDHEEMNEQLRQSFGVRVGGYEPDEASKRMNAWIRQQRADTMLFDPTPEADDVGESEE